MADATGGASPQDGLMMLDQVRIAQQSRGPCFSLKLFGNSCNLYCILLVAMWQEDHMARRLSKKAFTHHRLSLGVGVRIGF
jgi:hypothetical protein